MDTIRRDMHGDLFADRLRRSITTHISTVVCSIATPLYVFTHVIIGINCLSNIALAGVPFWLIHRMKLPRDVKNGTIVLSILGFAFVYNAQNDIAVTDCRQLFCCIDRQGCRDEGHVRR